MTIVTLSPINFVNQIFYKITSASLFFFSLNSKINTFSECIFIGHDIIFALFVIQFHPHIFITKGVVILFKFDRVESSKTTELNFTIVQKTKRIVNGSKSKHLQSSKKGLPCVRSARRRFPAFCTLTVFRDHSTCGRRL